MNHVCLFIFSTLFVSCVSAPFIKCVSSFFGGHRFLGRDMTFFANVKSHVDSEMLFARKLWPPMRIFLIAMRGAPLLNRSLSNDFKLSTHRSFILDGPVRQIIANKTCFCELSSFEFGNIDWNSICFTVFSRFVIDPEIVEFHQSV